MTKGRQKRFFLFLQLIMAPLLIDDESKSTDGTTIFGLLLNKYQELVPSACLQRVPILCNPLKSRQNKHVNEDTCHQARLKEQSDPPGLFRGRAQTGWKEKS